VQVTTVELGDALGADKRVKAASTSFSPKDTIFASVVTEGGGAAAELGARWSFQDGQVVNETKRTIAPTATPSAVAVTEFSIQKPNGFPVGEYKVEISLDGKVVQTVAFKVR
jgi:riboflavin biosynthesis pyrimidine reductase